jgi:hypothetical protein
MHGTLVEEHRIDLLSLTEIGDFDTRLHRVKHIA